MDLLFYPSHIVGQFLSARLSHKTYQTRRQQHARALSQAASQYRGLQTVSNHTTQSYVQRGLSK